MAKDKKKKMQNQRKDLSLTEEAIQKALKDKDISVLTEIADRAHYSHLPDVALKAIEALESLDFKDKVILILKKAQVFTQYGNALKAIELLKPYLDNNPEDVRARKIIIGAYVRIIRYDLALEHQEFLLKKDGNDPLLWTDYAKSLDNTGQRSKAEEALFKALELDPDCSPAWAILPIVALERIPETLQGQRESIQRCMDYLDRLRDWLLKERDRPSRFSQHFVTFGLFAAAYYPGDITPLLRKWGEVCEIVFPNRQLQPRPKRQKIRLGIFSRQIFRQSVFYVFLRGLIRYLDRRFFEVVVFNATANPDDMTEWVRGSVDRYYPDRPNWREVLEAEACDVLFYPDTTMDFASVHLAMQRFAPLQVTTWGHPASSGLRSIDLFFSGELLESDDAISHYIERLILLPGTGACSPKIEFSPTNLPSHLEELFNSERPIALVPAYAFKLVPSDDDLWIEIATTYPELRLVFFKQSFLGLAGIKPLERIEEAFKGAGLDFGRHGVIIECLPGDQFNGLLRKADIYLDVPSFSGYTTAWQGIQAGIPIVTLEGRYLRQRLAMGLLRLAGITDTIAKDKRDYLKIVGRLIKERMEEPERWATRRQRIKEASSEVCNDLRVVRAFERVILEELSLRGSSTAEELLIKHKETYPEYRYQREGHRVVAPEKGQQGRKAMEDRQKILTKGEPVWKLLDGELHMQTLSQVYAPIGLLEMVEPTVERVLDIGCFVGGSGRWLKERNKGVYVVGVEPLRSAAEKAKAIYDEVYACIFEELDTGRWGSYFDAVIAADVLEHMKNPWQALERIREVLRANGYLYVSLPNVRNLRVVEALATSGEWQYEGAGILDITHLRFFTRRSALRMFNETGWQAIEVRANIDPALAQLIQGKDLRQIKNIQLERLAISGLEGGEALEFFVLQWFFKLKPV